MATFQSLVVFLSCTSEITKTLHLIHLILAYPGLGGILDEFLGLFINYIIITAVIIAAVIIA